MLFAADIETTCAVGDCGGHCQADHALTPHLGRITLIGFWSPETGGHAFRTVDEARAFLAQYPDYKLLGQNFSFDYRFLKFHGLDIPLDRWEHDTQIMAAVCLDKVSEDYLSAYAARREEENDKLPKGYSHRPGSQYSLKVMAPYFLHGVQPFWEDPTNHDNIEYNLKDAEYTYRLYEFFAPRLKEQGTWDFYTKHQMRWARRLLQMSIDGIHIDLFGLQAAEEESRRNEAKYKAQLDELWKPAYEAYFEQRLEALKQKYHEMAVKAAAKAKTAEQAEKTHARYTELLKKAWAKEPKEMNLASPKQLTWILRDYFGLDIRDWEDEESTGRAVLQKLIREGRKDLEVFLAWRTESKRLTAFYPTYWELQRGGKLHTSFNPTGARTGRISSSKPNLQQCPPHIRRLFYAPEGYELAVFDMAAIEPRIVCYYTEDRKMYELLTTKHDFFHGQNAAVLFGLECDIDEVKKLHKFERGIAKTGGLGILYGAGPRRLQNIGLTQGVQWTLEQCKQMVERLRNAYPGVKEFKKALDAHAKHAPITGYFGQKYSYPNHDDIHLKALNSLVQGTASQLVVDAADRVARAFEAEGIDGRPLLVVHDELICLIPEGHARAVEIIKHCMTDYKLPTPHGNVPLEVEGKVSKRWEK